MLNAETLPDTGFVRLPTILHIFPISRSHWWAGVRAGKYPKGVKLSDRCTAWKVEDIRSLIERTAQDAVSGKESAQAAPARQSDKAG